MLLFSHGTSKYQVQCGSPYPKVWYFFALSLSMGGCAIGEVLFDLDGGVVLSVPQLDSVATYEPPFTKSKLSQA